MGEFDKPTIRGSAREAGLLNADKADSQDICFVPDGDYVSFLRDYGHVELTPGDFVDREGRVLGRHKGLPCYTTGQRKGLGIGGRRESLFVLATDVGQNVIYVGEGDAHPGLYRKALFMKAGDLHWIDPAERMRAGQRRRFRVRIRYRQPLQGAELVVCDEGGYLLFDEPQRGVTPGQFAVWYDGETLVGSGVIDR